MAEIYQTDEYKTWLAGLKDVRALAKVLARVGRLSCGNPGDVAPVGQGVSEMRIFYGPGYRVYFQTYQDGFLLLYGGDKSTQQDDIAIALKLSAEI